MRSENVVTRRSVGGLLIHLVTVVGREEGFGLFIILGFLILCGFGLAAG